MRNGHDDAFRLCDEPGVDMLSAERHWLRGARASRESRESSRASRASRESSV